MSTPAQPDYRRRLADWHAAARAALDTHLAPPSSPGPPAAPANPAATPSLLAALTVWQALDEALDAPDSLDDPGALGGDLLGTPLRGTLGTAVLLAAPEAAAALWALLVTLGVACPPPPSPADGGTPTAPGAPPGEAAAPPCAAATTVAPAAPAAPPDRLELVARLARDTAEARELARQCRELVAEVPDAARVAGLWAATDDDGFLDAASLDAATGRTADAIAALRAVLDTHAALVRDLEAQHRHARACGLATSRELARRHDAAAAHLRARPCELDVAAQLVARHRDALDAALDHAATVAPAPADTGRGWVAELWVDPDRAAASGHLADCPTVGPPAELVVDSTGDHDRILVGSAPGTAHAGALCSAGDPGLYADHLVLRHHQRRWHATASAPAWAHGPHGTRPLPTGREVTLEPGEHLTVGWWSRLVLRPDHGVPTLSP